MEIVISMGLYKKIFNTQCSMLNIQVEVQVHLIQGLIL
jgi:hypothetical protein